jgi:AcrR family transcriptional regulator
MSIEPLTPERRRQQTRDYLLKAAAKVFAEQGFNGVSLDQVAAAAGFTKGAVYSNFTNKEDLLMALLESIYDEEMQGLRAVLAESGAPPEARLSDFVDLIWSGQSPEQWTPLYLEFCLYAKSNDDVRKRLATLDRAQAQAIADIIEAGRARMGVTSTDSSLRVAELLLALFHGIGLLRVVDPPEVNKEFFETTLAFVYRALGVEG